MKNLLPYIYDFLTFVFDDSTSRKYIKDVILFGSVATGEYDKESDIDLFINVNSEELTERVEKILKEAEGRFYTLVNKKWSLLGIELPIKCIVGSLDTYKWSEIKSEVISTGISLYGKYIGIKEGLKHFALFSYSLTNLSNKKKVLFIRNFFGYSQKKRKKIYRKLGLLEESGGVKIGKNSALIPLEKSREMQKFFMSFKLTPEIREVWIKD